MLAIDFPGSRRLIDMLDCAVRKECEAAITDALRLGLCRLMHNKEVELPECVFQAKADHYARRELYNSEELGYSVMAMTWGLARARSSTIIAACGASKVSGTDRSKSAPMNLSSAGMTCSALNHVAPCSPAPARQAH